MDATVALYLDGTVIDGVEMPGAAVAWDMPPLLLDVIVPRASERCAPARPANPKSTTVALAPRWANRPHNHRFSSTGRIPNVTAIHSSPKGTQALLFQRIGGSVSHSVLVGQILSGALGAQWRQMRRGVADMHRRAEVSQKSNERYRDALSTVDDSTRFHEFTRALEQPCQYQQRRAQRAPGALHPFQADDHRLPQAVNRGEFALNGHRNRDLQRWLYEPADPLQPLPLKENCRRSAAVSRKLRILRAHGLIQKVPKTHRYQVTPHGRLAITAILPMDRTSIAPLNQAAAA